MKIRIASAIIAIALVVPFIIIGGFPFAVMISLIGIICYKDPSSRNGCEAARGTCGRWAHRGTRTAPS